MSTTQAAPYGFWRSPITSEMIVAETIQFEAIAVDHEDIYWIESRPSEGGRNVLVRRTPDGTMQDITPAPFNVRTRVHEYGGGAFTVADGIVYFANFSDQRLYRQTSGTEPTAITLAGDFRYADLVFDRHRKRIICIREDHTPGNQEAVNTLVSILPDNNAGGQIIVAGNDFYASPRISPAGKYLAWLAWNHPNMPWDGTELWIGELRDDGTIGQAQRIAGGITESIFQPEWSPDGLLYFISDATGWWNIYRWNNGQIEPLYNMEAEFGLPQWVFWFSTYAFESADRLICSYCQEGQWRLGELPTSSAKLPTSSAKLPTSSAKLPTSSHRLTSLDIPYTPIHYVRTTPEHVIFLGGSPTDVTAVIQLQLQTKQIEVLKASTTLNVDVGYLSSPQSLSFPTEHGETAYAYYYPPQNQDYTGLPDDQPPLLVLSHGGPTAATSTVLNFSIQYWTSRGFAVADVNYGGSTGYGRAYRERLKGQWGIVDVDDCVNCARYLSEKGYADKNRLAIRGGSAGGYTTLCALTFHDIFQAGASYFGVSDLEILAKETHKFESRYLDTLVGVYPAHRDRYQARSPIHFTKRLSCPMIFFQGLEDKIVPPNQSELMFESLRSQNIPVAYLSFESEQHGFRRAETIKRCLDAELYFYARIFGFPLADEVEPITIENILNAR